MADRGSLEGRHSWRSRPIDPVFYKDLTELDPLEEVQPFWVRRRALTAIAGTGVAAGAAAAVAGIALSPGLRRSLGLSDDGSDPSNGDTPSALGGFSDRDASYARSAGDPFPLPVGTADTPSAAARAAAKFPIRPTILFRDPVLHLLRRTTFGLTPQVVSEATRMGIDAWIERQLKPSAIPNTAADRVLTAFPTVSMTTAQVRSSIKEHAWDAMFQLGQATLARQIWSTRQLHEVMVDFFANHLNVATPFDRGWDVRTTEDRDVIRKHAFGKFSDMLLASARSPSMLRYLNNTDSHKRSVNENYGRELLELHTVGINGGYNETDVRMAAYIMTGRTANREGMFVYEPRRHWTGRVKVLGFTHANSSAAGGLAVGDAFVRYLATHPSTAQYLARKIAVRFVNDDPPQTLVDRLAKTYLANGTAILPVLRMLFRSLEFWGAVGQKTRRPLENLVATARVLGVQPGRDVRGGTEGLYFRARDVGQAPLSWEAPNGFPDVAAAWNSAQSTLQLWNTHRGLVQGWWKELGYTKPEQLLGGSAPGTVGAYIDALSHRLVFQRLGTTHRAALLKFLGASNTTPVRDATLRGMIQHLVPLILDSGYHALR